LQAGGHRFDPVHLHHLIKRQTKVRGAHFRLVFDQTLFRSLKIWKKQSVSILRPVMSRERVDNGL
jgi:hypothetical protein